MSTGWTFETTENENKHKGGMELSIHQLGQMWGKSEHEIGYIEAAVDSVVRSFECSFQTTFAWFQDKFCSATLIPKLSLLPLPLSFAGICFTGHYYP